MNKKTALYRHYNKDGVLLYVGISLSAVARLSQHNHKSCWAHEIVNMTTEWLGSRPEALIAEKKAIKEEKPLHNIAHNNVRSFKKKIKPIKKKSSLFNIKYKVRDLCFITSGPYLKEFNDRYKKRKRKLSRSSHRN